MLVLAFWLLLIAALGGLAMALLDAAATPAARLVHGGIAGLGLLALLVGALVHGTPLLWSAFGLLAIGFAAGATLFGLVWADRAPPRVVIAAHGLINAAGVIALAIAVYG